MTTPINQSAIDVARLRELMAEIQQTEALIATKLFEDHDLAARIKLVDLRLRLDDEAVRALPALLDAVEDARRFAWYFGANKSAVQTFQLAKYLIESGNSTDLEIHRAAIDAAIGSKP